MPSKLKQEPVQKIKLKTYFRPKDAHLKTVKLSAPDIEIILLGLHQYKAQGVGSALPTNAIRCDALLEIFLHHLESFKNDY